jgi:hypothetical protein
VVVVTLARRDKDYPISIGQWIFIVCFSGFSAASMARCSGAFASVENVEVARTTLVPFDVDAKYGNGAAYIMDEQHIGVFNNSVSHKYTVQVKENSGIVKEIPISFYEARADCDPELPDPTMITYETRLLYPKMSPWIIWWPERHRCITPDPFRLMAVK